MSIDKALQQIWFSDHLRTDSPEPFLLRPFRAFFPRFPNVFGLYWTKEHPFFGQSFGQAMPRAQEMTWKATSRRWSKMYRGKVYYVSCRELGTAETKLASQQAANLWWQRKRLELDGNGHTWEARLERLGDFLEDTTGLPVETAEQYRNALQSWLVGGNVVGQPDLAGALDRLGTTREQMAVEAIEGTATEQTVGHWRKQWNATQDAKLASGALTSEASLRRNKDCLSRFVDWIKPSTSVATLDETTLDGFHSYLATSEWSQETRRKTWIYTKDFVRYLYERRQIELPRNLERLDAFTCHAKEIQVFSLDQVRQLLAEATGQAKLHLLLMLNCGFNGIDIANLKPQEVDWQAGIIRRKRSKTSKEKSVPMVSYQLWPETFDLLKEHRSNGAQVLTKPDGGKWESGGAADMRHLDRIRQRLGLALPLKNLRQTCGTLISHKFKDKDLSAYFLGHAPRGMEDRHYIRPDDSRLSEALSWLREQVM